MPSHRYVWYVLCENAGSGIEAAHMSGYRWNGATFTLHMAGFDVLRSAAGITGIKFGSHAKQPFRFSDGTDVCVAARLIPLCWVSYER